MSRLGARLSILLTLAILFVVVVATVLALQLLGPPPGGPGHRRVLAELSLAARMIDRLAPDAFARLIDGGPVRVAAERPAGEEIPGATRGLAEMLRREGARGEALMVEPERGPPIAAVRLPDGRWLVADAGGPSGPDGRAWFVFAFWMALIAVGVAGLVALFVMRATRPLAVIERAVGSVGPDGEFGPCLRKDRRR